MGVIVSYQEGYDEAVLYCVEALDEILNDWEGSTEELLEELNKLKTELATIYNEEK
jgi:hypothetical protein